MGHPRRTGPGHQAHPPRDHAHRRHLSPARTSCRRRRHRRRHVRRSSRVRHRIGLVRGGAPRLRNPVSGYEGALRSAGGTAPRSSPASGARRPARRTASRAEHFPLVDSPALPKPRQRPRPPVIVGGWGAKRTPAIAARFADEYNIPMPAPGHGAGDVRQRRSGVRGDRPGPGGDHQVDRPRRLRRHRRGRVPASGRRHRARPRRSPRRRPGGYGRGGSPSSSATRPTVPPGCTSRSSTWMTSTICVCSPTPSSRARRVRPDPRRGPLVAVLGPPGPPARRPTLAIDMPGRGVHPARPRRGRT